MPTSLGFLFGVRAGAFVAERRVSRTNRSFDDVGRPGPAAASTRIFRVARMPCSLGGTVEYAELGNRRRRSAAFAANVATADGSVHTTYAGLLHRASFPTSISVIVRRRRSRATASLT